MRFLGGKWQKKITATTKAIKSVASPFGLCSVRPFRRAVTAARWGGRLQRRFNAKSRKTSTTADPLRDDNKKR
jgi:hypothetical protein